MSSRFLLVFLMLSQTIKRQSFDLIPDVHNDRAPALFGSQRSSWFLFCLSRVVFSFTILRRTVKLRYLSPNLSEYWTVIGTKITACRLTSQYQFCLTIAIHSQATEQICELGDHSKSAGSLVFEQSFQTARFSFIVKSSLGSLSQPV